MTNTTRAASPPAGRLAAGGPTPNVHPHNAGLVALRCTAGIIFGPLTLFHPLHSLAILVLLLGACSLVDGGGTAMAAMANRRNGAPWGGLLATSLAEIVTGVAVLALPGLAAVGVLGIVRMGIALRRWRGPGDLPAAGEGAP